MIDGSPPTVPMRLGEQSARGNGGLDQYSQEIRRGRTQREITRYTENDNNDDNNNKETNDNRRQKKRRNRKRYKKQSNNSSQSQRTERNWRQTSLRGGSYGHRQFSAWGDTITTKQPETLRIGFQNINTFPDSSRAPKNGQLHDLISNNEFDIFGMAEVNRHWKNVPADRGIHEQTWTWFEHKHISYSFNKEERPANEFQVGGTAVFSRDKTVSTIRKADTWNNRPAVPGCLMSSVSLGAHVVLSRSRRDSILAFDALWLQHLSLIHI